jgi:hypothetical protein
MFRKKLALKKPRASVPLRCHYSKKHIYIYKYDQIHIEATLCKASAYMLF